MEWTRSRGDHLLVFIHQLTSSEKGSNNRTEVFVIGQQFLEDSSWIFSTLGKRLTLLDIPELHRYSFAYC